MARTWDITRRTYDLGFTAFGGPPVHFQIFHRRFVDGNSNVTPWIDEQTYQELFAISQALPGPASTKMLFSIAQIHGGIMPAIVAFLIWSLPGAIGMYGLSLGIQNVSTTLPGPAYALVSGLNAATVGIIALAAVQLARKAITDKLTRLLVVTGGCAGMCYNSLWYIPVLITAGGLISLSWDCFLQPSIKKIQGRSRRSQIQSEWNDVAASDPSPSTSYNPRVNGLQRRTESNNNTASSPSPALGVEDVTAVLQPSLRDISAHHISVKAGMTIVVVFVIVFTVFMVLRGILKNPHLLLSLFTNMFLAGTIIFGGGPVVIPLLRDYVVEPGWVTPRDFLLGLAIIQAFPGPNFNFAVYLGALTVAGRRADIQIHTFVGALLAFLGIFIPGLWLSLGFQSLWRALRKRRVVISILRGVNAAAVGFIFTAVYRLWQIGHLTPREIQGTSLGNNPWWLVVTAITYTIVEWFAIPPPVAIVMGGVAGLGWWGILRPD
ncbi:chromate transporter-domain-containing protein [Cyathus striatus]|nr:chromate transporter-domain-containing protein [Cyathus striatus]